MSTMRAAMWLGGLLVAAGAISACSGESMPAGAGDLGSDSEAAIATNGLATNGLATNGLATNGLATNGLATNGLATNGLATNGLMQSGLTDPSARAFLQYAVGCALSAGDSVAFTDSNGASWTFTGELGLAPQWKTGAMDASAQRWVSACVSARVNGYAVRKIISMRAPTGPLASPSASELADFPAMEGAYYGNLFVAGQAVYMCESTVKFGSGARSNQQGENSSPIFHYMGYCQGNPATGAPAVCNGTAANGSVSGCSDGTSKVATKGYAEVITVYRNAATPTHSDFTVGAAIPAGATPCAYKVARQLYGTSGDSYCGASAWDAICVSEAKQACGDHSVTYAGHAVVILGRSIWLSAPPLHLGDSECIDYVCAGFDYETWNYAPAGFAPDPTCCTGAWGPSCKALAQQACGLY